MGTLTGNPWVCAECRSINNEGAKQCYNCRTPRDVAAVDPSTIEGTGHGKLRDIALPAFHSPRPFAVIASIAILATAGIQVIYTLDYSQLTLQTLDRTPATPLQLEFMNMIGLVTLAFGIVGLVMWSLWLSSAVAAMPALGLGYPAATRMTAFVENFLPGLNLLRVPAIVRDVVRRLDPGGNRSEALIFAAWIGLLGGFVVPRVFALINVFSADSPDRALRSQLTIQGVAIGLVLVGAIFLVTLIWWIEARIARRREAQLAAIDAATASGAVAKPVEVADEGVSIPEPSVPSEPIPAAQPATARWSWGESTGGSTRLSPNTIAGSAAGWDTELLPPLRPDPALSPAAAAAPAAAPAAEVPMQAQHEVPAEPEPVAEAAPPPEPEPEPERESEMPPAPVLEVAVAPDAASAAQPEPAAAPTAAAPNGAPHLTIRIANHGMLQAEMAGDAEPVILEDLPAYGQALANVGGTAEIVVAGSDGMASLIARRAQRILAETGIEASIPN